MRYEDEAHPMSIFKVWKSEEVYRIAEHDLQMNRQTEPKNYSIDKLSSEELVKWHYDDSNTGGLLQG